ncbi:MAG TPA: hypothetical protein VGM58_03395 [Verrucomicrobiae bacterium]
MNKTIRKNHGTAKLMVDFLAAGAYGFAGFSEIKMAQKVARSIVSKFLKLHVIQ